MDTTEGGKRLLLQAKSVNFSLLIVGTVRQNFWRLFINNKQMLKSIKLYINV